MNNLEVKANILSKGISLSPNFIKNYPTGFIEKRRAYGNQDPLTYRSLRIPQEIYIKGEKDLIVAANINTNSTWQLDFLEESFYVSNGINKYSVSFPPRPNFYDGKLSDGKKVSSLVTLYGGASLGIFAYGKCQLVNIGKPCHYCSISQNRNLKNDFLEAISVNQIEESLEYILKDLPPKVNQIMINGGNFPDMDKSFIHYVSLAKAAKRIVDKFNANVDVHLIVYPPQNLELINLLKDQNISIAINTEIFDPILFAKYCPGKVETAGRDHILKSLEKSVSILGKGKVFSILVGGLEPLESLKKGMNFLAEKGITPVVNVLHTDPGTPLENFPNPSVDFILSMGRGLMNVYNEFSLKPFYLNCGRNSLDTEAYFNLF